MTLAGQEIQRNLRRLARGWHGYQGTERAEAQTFVNELFACYGTDRRTAGVEFEFDERRPDGSRGFVDAFWPGRCLLEMKRPSEADSLPAHREQALDYWRHSADPASNRPAVEYVVVCAFSRIEVWQPGRFPLAPRAELTLAELPDRYEALLFLGEQRPLFVSADRALTTAAAERVVELHRRLMRRDAADADVLQGFVLQVVWCLFASSLGLLPGFPLQRIVRSLLADPSGERSSAAELGHLFTTLARRDMRRQGGVYARHVYVNGGLFELPALVHLEREELELLADLGQFDWSQVEPTIFGSLLEGFLPRDRAAEAGTRSQFGVHYTHEVDIQKIVGPTIVEPWTGRIEGATSSVELRSVLDELAGLRILDPACGCGNFLYVAYRELRDLEARARARLDELCRAEGVSAPDPSALPTYPLANLHGIEVDAFAVGVTRLVLWIGHKLAADRHGHTAERVLPLPDLSATIIREDALKVPWPEVDAVIGNPPFVGSQRLRAALGDDQVAWLERTFEVGVRDYCTYWYRRAADHLPAGGRAGLVGTSSIARGRGREASLDHVVSGGGVITDAVSSQIWPGEANVHVSIVNWVQRPLLPVARFVLDGEEVPDGIGADLVPAALSTVDAARLTANGGVAFQGVIPVGDGFLLAEDEGDALRRRRDADYTEVVRRYLIGDDIAEEPEQQPRRWIIDFADRTLEQAAGYPAALSLVRERVKPERDRNARPMRRSRWWRFGENAIGMRQTIGTRARYLAVGAQGKRPLFSWCDTSWCPSNLVYAIALDEDHHFGILTSAAHTLWAAMRGSTLKSDPRYTNTTVFETFPWPDLTDEDRRERVASAARRVVAERTAACDGVRGLTAVYNLMDEGGFTDLATAHHELDLAVAAAYGWPAAAAADPYELIPRLMALNRETAEGRRAYHPFGQAHDTASEQGVLYLPETARRG